MLKSVVRWDMNSWCSETSVHFYHTIQRNIPEDNYIYSHHCVNLRSHLTCKYNQFILILVLKAEMLLTFWRRNYFFNFSTLCI